MRKCRVRVLQGAPPVTPAEEASLSRGRERRASPGLLPCGRGRHGPGNLGRRASGGCHRRRREGSGCQSLGEAGTGWGPESTIHHQRDIAARGRGSGCQGGAPQCLPALAHLKAGEDYSVVVRGHTIIHVREGFRPVYGIAVDIGTTTMAAYLWTWPPVRKWPWSPWQIPAQLRRM